MGKAGGNSNGPTLAPGYSAMCSGTYNDSKPQLSACRATAITERGSTP
jgi:hypothetical protein